MRARRSEGTDPLNNGSPENISSVAPRKEAVFKNNVTLSLLLLFTVRTLKILV
jgi:hypothetical protein